MNTLSGVQPKLTEHRERLTRRGKWLSRTTLQFAAAIALLIAAFSPTFLTFHDRWAATGSGYSHGYLVAALVLWLLARSHRTWLTAARPHLTAALLLIPISLAWFLSRQADVQLGEQLLLPIILAAWIFSVSGWSALRSVMPVLFIFSLAIPVWDYLGEPLRILTVVVTTWLVQIFDITVYIEASTIHLPAGSLMVASGCSGLNYILVSLLLSVLYGHLYLSQRRWHAAVITFAVLLGLLANWIRVTGLVLVAYASDMRAALIADHEFYGWVIFAIALVPFFTFASWVSKRDSGGKPPPQKAQRSTAAFKFDASSGWHSTAAVGLATLAAVSGPLLNLATNVRATLPTSENIPAIADLPPWLETVEAPRALSLPVWEPRFDGANHHDRTLVHDTRKNAFLTVDRLLYTNQSQGQELVNDLNKIADYSRIRMQREVALSASRPDTVIETVVRTPTHQTRLVWSWYWLNGRTATTRFEAKLLELRALLFRGRRFSGLIAVSARCDNSNCTEARRSIKRLVSDTALVVR